MFKFESLHVWEKAFDLGEKINLIVNDFPDKEKFNLTSQVRRAVDSIGLNIAEGSAGQSNPEQIKFLTYANRSLLEVVACLLKAKHRKYIGKEVFIDLYNSCSELSKMISAFKIALLQK